MKKQLARLILRWQMGRMARDANPFNRLLGKAVRLQLGQSTEGQFRQELDAFYAELDRHAVMEDIGFTAKAAQLNRPNGYKVGILGLRDDFPDGTYRKGFRLWARRFGLLHHLGVRSDVLILRRGEQIPPHGHYRVVSGFYVLEGEVAARHFDRVREEGDRVWLRKSLDAALGPGGFTTNSEYHQNIHWLWGIAEVSYLFRFTVSGTPTPTFGGAGRADERVYVDPTGTPSADGLILAPYISAQEAKALRFVAAAASIHG